MEEKRDSNISSNIKDTNESFFSLIKIGSVVIMLASFAAGLVAGMNLEHYRMERKSGHTQIIQQSGIGKSSGELTGRIIDSIDNYEQGRQWVKKL